MLSNARQSLADVPELPETHEDSSSPTHILAETATLHDERRDTLDGTDLIRMVHTNRVHKKTASNSTIVSGIVMRAEAETDENERRASLDGKQRLQAAFGMRQSDEGPDVDWSTCHWHCPFSLADIYDSVLGERRVRLPGICRCSSTRTRESDRAGNPKVTTWYDMAVNVGRTSQYSGTMKEHTLMICLS